ncbi:FTR1 family protein [Candidatus Roizmanbacteria bacterium]|nr:MAG: FTR1 family protein [Candidatus Roizmanbacteria bacterium]
MLPAFLITFREVIEATLIVATILGILYKLNHTKSIKTVWYATGIAALTSALLLLGGSILGVKMQELYTGRVEELIEGIFMVTSAIFITWAVFFLHSYFGKYKVQLLQKVKKTLETQEQKGIFVLVFTAVFREGFEIVLFLSTIYFSSDPAHIFTGFASGIIAGLIVSYLFFNATVKMPIYYAFRVTSALLILFAAGLLSRGIHEFAEAGLLPEIGNVIFHIVPAKGTFVGDMIKAVFGITQSMDYVQVSLYLMYTAAMTWFVFFRKSTAEET